MGTKEAQTIEGLLIMTITYHAVKQVLQILIDKGIQPDHAEDFLSDCFPLEMGVAWKELRPELQAKYPNIVDAVERYSQDSPNASQPNEEQLKLL